jgi:hypothetical protein
MRASTAKTDVLALSLFSAQFLARVFRQSSALKPSMSPSKLEAYGAGIAVSFRLLQRLPPSGAFEVATAIAVRTSSSASPRVCSFARST